MSYKHSKEEIKHWCDNCCCCDCRQTKKEKLECMRRLKESPKPMETPKAQILFVDDVVEKPITEDPKPYLFEKFLRDFKDRKVPNEKIYIYSQHIDFAEFENWKGAKNEKED